VHKTSIFAQHANLPKSSHLTKFYPKPKQSPFTYEPDSKPLIRTLKMKIPAHIIYIYYKHLHLIIRIVPGLSPLLKYRQWPGNFVEKTLLSIVEFRFIEAAVDWHRPEPHRVHHHTTNHRRLQHLRPYFCCPVLIIMIWSCEGIIERGGGDLFRTRTYVSRTYVESQLFCYNLCQFRVTH
jgi:hypothetical protein